MQENRSQPGIDEAPIVPIDFSPASARRRGLSLRLRPLQVFVLAFLAAAGLAAWFVLTARSVYVQTDPPVATIEVESGFALRLGQRYLMRPGSYALKLSHEGYHDARSVLEVGEDIGEERRPGRFAW